MKKAFKIFGILFLLLIITAVAAPIVFKDKFAGMIKTLINKQINAQVDFDDVDISLINNFPKASLQIEGLSITNFEPFKGDTLFYAKEIGLTMPLSGLTKTAEDAITINAFTIDEALVNIISNKNGITNYDIAKKKENKQPTKTEDTNAKGFAFTVEEYAINNSTVNYIDESSNLKLALANLNHKGAGDLSAAKTTLNTLTDGTISLNKGVSNYLDNHSLSLEADLDIDQETGKISFLENTFKLNQLALKFNGFVKNTEETEVDIKFNTPTSDFKNFIAVLPKQYSKNINSIKTNGSFAINGDVKGKITETTIPNFNIQVNSKNASFKYPDLPKKVENINLIAAISNTTGNINDTFLDLEKLSLQIDQDVFHAQGKITNLPSDNRYVSAKLDGTLNLANLSQAYPVVLENDLKGIVKANLQTAFSQKAIEDNQYEKIKNNGNFSVSGFEFASKDIVNPINISEAKVDFTPSSVNLEKFDATSGSSDFKANGTIDNLFGFLFSDKKLKGDFKVNSQLFKVDDFMVDNTEDGNDSENTQKKSEKGEGLKIPAFLDAKITANAKKVIYDNLTLNNLKGDLVIKDETASLQNLTTDMFDGRMAIDGNISTKNETPTFALDLGIDKFDISKSFKGMDLLTSLAPIAKMVQGKLNTNLKLSGNLNKEFSPDLNSLTGNALAEILTTKVVPENSKALNLLNDKLPFIDLDKLDLKNLKSALSFKEGKVNISPFDVKYDDITITIAGGHGFDNSLGYTATFDVPAKYFGNEVSGLLSKLNEEDIKDVKVPVTANINGSFSQPSVKTDLKNSVSNLTKQLVQIQKDKLLGQGTDAVKDVLGGLLGGGNNNQETDSTSNSSDSNNGAVKDLANDVIGGLFGKKKKDSTEKK
ncbi:AsmA-like C-terminal region-containing protein [Pseudofulvibacter geojedonensis]|uniref:AsmA-like C-terminal region-containing protein n=1 Tax=Pseudofulvibacter geojedonensis TaxID=1123758 RepID=A0ABW3I5F5_9FLAO